MAKTLVIGPYAKNLRHLRGGLLRKMMEAGHQVFACAPDVPEDVQNQLAAMNVQYCNVPFDRNGTNPLADIGSLAALYRVTKKIRPDVVLSYNVKPVIYASLGAGLNKVPTICSIITGLGRSFNSETLQSRLLNTLVVSLYRMAIRYNNVVFFQNQDDLNTFRSTGLLKDSHNVVRINGSGVDLSYFALCPAPVKTSFLLVSRLIKEKGVREFVAAAREIKGRHPAVSFKLAGWIDEKSNAITNIEIEKWTNEGVVEYLGPLDDVRPALAESSVFVLPSFYREGVPRTILEAMATGRPVITTDAPGCRDTVDDGVNGYLVPAKNVPALVKAMEKFIDQPDLIESMGLASREKAVKQYDEDKVNDTILMNLGMVKQH